jgi:glutamyl-tRNA reductase
MEHDLAIIGVNHRTASISVRERLVFADERLDDANRRLCGLDGIDEGAIVCTCNRVEVVVCAHGGESSIQHVTHFLRDEQEDPAESIEPHLYIYRGREAVRHVFRVASSLDSMVLGEPQILGQLKDFYARAASVGSAGVVLHRCFHKAFSVAKRVRTETGVGGRAVSVSSAAVELASKIFDRLEDKTAMLIGAGKMGELAARHLLRQGVGGMIVTNRTFDRAVELAREFRATPVPFESFPKYLQLADIVIGSTASTEFVLTETMVGEALRERKYRPVFCIDMSVPRNFDPRINELDNVYLYDIDDLGKVTEDNLGERAREADKAERLVMTEVESFWRWLGHLEVVPTIVALREKVEAIRRGELEKTLNSLKDLSPREREALESMTAAIVNKILHVPITRLKQPDHRAEAFYVDATRRLFDLENADES